MPTHKVYIDPLAFRELKETPGHIRQRLSQAAQALAGNPRPSQSRLRLDDWRLLYGVNEAEARVVVLAARKRPPYRYEDLVELMRRLAD